MHNTSPSANRDNFTSSFPIWTPFIYFPFLTALARPFITMLNKSWESEYPCLVSDFRRKAFSFLPLNTIWICHIWSLLCWGMGFPGGSVVKNPPAKAGDPGDERSIPPGLGRSHGGGVGNQLHYSCLENPMDRGTWQLWSIGLQRVGHDWAQHARMLRDIPSVPGLFKEKKESRVDAASVCGTWKHLVRNPGSFLVPSPGSFLVPSQVGSRAFWMSRIEPFWSLRLVLGFGASVFSPAERWNFERFFFFLGLTVQHVRS